ncbi:MAG TPA: hypothetical protein VEB59_01005 [Gemmatimonadales bacterium]|nr:hypothetical protein [Gemmatimonadales bacterium]
MTVSEIRSAIDQLLRDMFEHPIGSRPRRYQPAPPVLDHLSELAREEPVRDHGMNGDWRVVEGRRWLLNRRLDGRSVPMVQRDHVAVVVRSWSEARELARLLNWVDAPAPPRSSLVLHTPVADRPR